MAQVQGRTLRIEPGNGKTYMSASGLSIDVTVLGTTMLTRMYFQGKDGYATLNAEAMQVLYPNANAHPVKADSEYSAAIMTANTRPYVALEFGGTEVQKLYPKVANSAQHLKQDGLTDTAILSSTMASEIRYHHYCNSTVNPIGMYLVDLTLYFNRYACAALASGDGITSAAVSNDAPWDGDSVIFTATLAAGATFDGWYSDAACTQRVSTELSYTAAAADLTLYAKATLPTGTGVYLKRAGTQAQAAGVWKKENGLWVKADKTAIDAGKNYRIIQEG